MEMACPAVDRGEDWAVERAANLDLAAAVEELQAVEATEVEREVEEAAAMAQAAKGRQEVALAGLAVLEVVDLAATGLAVAAVMAWVMKELAVMEEMTAIGVDGVVGLAVAGLVRDSVAAYAVERVVAVVEGLVVAGRARAVAPAARSHSLPLQ